MNLLHILNKSESFLNKIAAISIIPLIFSSVSPESKIILIDMVVLFSKIDDFTLKKEFISNLKVIYCIII